MGQLLLFIVVALTVAAIVFGVTVMLSGGDPGLSPVEPDGRALPLPGDRPLGEEDVATARFDTAVRGYRMAQVDQALQRAAYDIGYKGELIGVLEAEVTALREGRTADADVLRRAREAAVQPAPVVQSIADDPVVPSADSAVPAGEQVDIQLAPTAPDSPDATGPAAEVAAVPPVADDVAAAMPAGSQPVPVTPKPAGAEAPLPGDKPEVADSPAHK